MRTRRRRALTALVAVVAIAAVAAGIAAGGNPQVRPPRQDGGLVVPGSVVSGPARFQVLSPTLVRLEYAADGRFEDGPTFTVPVRPPPVPVTTRREDGWLVLDTGRLSLRYREGSGAFTEDNVRVTLDVAGQTTEARPRWPPTAGTCAFGTRCEAEDGRLRGGQSVAHDRTGALGRGHTVDRGQVGASAAFTVTGVPADGEYLLRTRYAHEGRDDRTLRVDVDGRAAGQLVLAPARGWAGAGLRVRLRAGDNVLTTRCTADDSCRARLDTLSVTPSDAPEPPAADPPEASPGQLGGTLRGLDRYTNQAGLDPERYRLQPGVLDRRGWSLLDDTATALRTADGWVAARPARTGAHQDGYVFGYGHDYVQALRDLRLLTGPAVLLPAWAFGVWFSEYRARDAAALRRIVDRFAAEDVPLDALSVDTDWKSPDRWYGWSWEEDLFPDPEAFLAWAAAEQVSTVLNVHGGISARDPAFARTQARAGGRLLPGALCFSPGCYRFDWADRRQAEAWFALHRPLQEQGVRQWWFDWCCTDSVVDLEGLTPDSWINELYARELDSPTRRGFVLARQGASVGDYRGSYPAGAWGEHRSTVHFTGDTRSDWASLALTVRLSPAEASIGQPWVSHDIGGFKGRHLADDLYLRWVQAGTFQPVLRLHSHHGDRLPWQYPAVARPAAGFLRLREALAPYTYSLAWEAHMTGLPLTRPLYLHHPEEPEAYTHPEQYLYGPDVLVAPVTRPGRKVRQEVWFPPGEWTDFFTGRTVTGPTTEQVEVPLDRIPVYVRSGAVVVQLPGVQRVQPDPASLALTVYAGSQPGRFTLHTDEGEGSGYREGRFADTELSATPGERSSRVDIGAARGSHPGMVTARSYTVTQVNLTAPTMVRVDGREVPQTSAEGQGVGWWHDGRRQVLHVRTGPLATGTAHVVEQVGGRRR